jgi:hypothetical protein
MDLKVDGFNQIRIVTNDTGLKVIYGNAWLEMDATNMDQYDF